MKKQYKRVLTIAGSDSGGGAGIQADLKAFSALGCYGMSAITAVTAQNTEGVRDIHPIPPAVLKTQIEAVLEDIGADAVKIGMLHSPEVIRTVAEALAPHPELPVVLDPVMVATSGDRLLQEEAIAVLKEVMIPRASVITPNIPEAEILLDRPLKKQEDLPDAAREMTGLGCPAVLLKAGHLKEEELIDYLYDSRKKGLLSLPSRRMDTPNTHGTGCTLSSALAACLAVGLSLPEAAKEAKTYLSRAIEAGSAYSIGRGYGPVHHFHALWREA
jgi:hydroxymethylpyrimidine/phosphomethylpyrimidine kinase